METLRDLLMEVIAGTRNSMEEGTWIPRPILGAEWEALVSDMTKGVATTPAPTQAPIPVLTPIQQVVQSIINSPQIPLTQAQINAYSAMDRGAPAGAAPSELVVQGIIAAGLCIRPDGTQCTDVERMLPIHKHAHYISECSWPNCDHQEVIVDPVWNITRCTQGRMNNDQRVKKFQLERDTKLGASRILAQAQSTQPLPGFGA